MDEVSADFLQNSFTSLAVPSVRDVMKDFKDTPNWRLSANRICDRTDSALLFARIFLMEYPTLPRARGVLGTVPAKCGNFPSTSFSFLSPSGVFVR